MKKYPYIVAAACVVVGAIGFSSIYATDQSEKQKELAQNKKLVEEHQSVKEDDYISNSEIALNQGDEGPFENDVDLQLEPNLEEEMASSENESEGEDHSDEVEVGTIKEEEIHFDLNGDLMWPTEGAVLLDYSMDSTIFFPTLQQYQYNPAMIFAADVNSKVYFAARGKITNIVTNEETGCTITQDLGDGYTAVYGQLKELNFEVGDMVEAGQVVGYVGEPTKYYAVEGSNVYFQILKNGIPVDPEEILP